MEAAGSDDTPITDSLTQCRRYAAFLYFPRVPWVCFAAPTAVGTTCLNNPLGWLFFSHSSAPIPLPGFLNLAGTLLYGMTVELFW